MGSSASEEAVTVEMYRQRLTELYYGGVENQHKSKDECGTVELLPEQMEGLFGDRGDGVCPRVCHSLRLNTSRG